MAIGSTRRLRRAFTALAVVAVGGTAVAASTPILTISDSAQVLEPAERLLPESVDTVYVHDSGPLDASTEQLAIAAATTANAQFSIRAAVSVPMVRVSRGGTVVQEPAAGFAIPMGTTILTSDTVSVLMGGEVSAVLSSTSIVMSELTASLRGAQTGDVITVQAASGAPRDYVIGAVVADEITGGTELLMTPDASARLGFERKNGVLIWGFPDRDTMMNALAVHGVIPSVNVGPGPVTNGIRLRRSWDPRDADGTLGMARTKALLGEFSYRPSPGSNWVTVDGTWTSANLPSGRVLLNSSIPIRAQCHNGIDAPLRAALAEIAAAGIGWTINVQHANSAGGCFAPRFNRLTPDSTIGFLSRHTWAMAIDTNTVGSCQGCAPPDFAQTGAGCQTVRIFRKHGFAWGGNFTTPDGMHFEYVGEPRDQIPYPSRFCPNIVEGAFVDADADLPVEMTERAVLFSDAGLIDGHSE